VKKVTFKPAPASAKDWVKAARDPEAPPKTAAMPPGPEPAPAEPTKRLIIDLSIDLGCARRMRTIGDVARDLTR
jgi:hypothetical protein